MVAGMKRGVWRRAGFVAIERALRASRTAMNEERDGLYDFCCYKDAKGRPMIGSLDDAAKPRVNRLTRAINQCDRSLEMLPKLEGLA